MGTAESNHTCDGGIQHGVIHGYTTIDKLYCIPPLQLASQSAHIVRQRKGNGGIIQRTIHDEHLRTGGHTAQVKGGIVNLQGTPGGHAYPALRLDFLNGDVAREGAISSKGHIVQGGIFGCRTGIELHIRQHGSMRTIGSGNEVMYRYSILRHRTPDISGNLQFHILQRAAGYAVGAYVQRAVKSGRPGHTQAFRHRDVATGEMITTSRNDNRPGLNTSTGNLYGFVQTCTITEFHRTSRHVKRFPALTINPDWCLLRIPDGWLTGNGIPMQNPIVASPHIPRSPIFCYGHWSQRSRAQGEGVHQQREGGSHLLRLILLLVFILLFLIAFFLIFLPLGGR